MKRWSFIILTLSLLILSLSAMAQNPRTPSAVDRAQNSKREILTNDSIISLIKANFKEKTILSLMRTSPVSFDLSAPKLIQLKKSGVNENLIQAMIERQTSNGVLATLSDDEFFGKKDDDDFFKKNPKFSMPDREPHEIAKDPDLFGSRSGGQSNTRRSGGGRDEQSGSGEVGGSARVTIIRPPSEGGSEPKLERAPKLNNKAIIEMVEAGFTEGTILRKIESSQVEFDITPKAVAELRKNHVTDKVIRALRDAMVETK
jgi:ribosomal protein L15